MRTVVTKTGRSAGKRMGIVTLEDLSGQVEVILFPNDLERFQSLLAPEAITFFKGQVDRRRQEPSLRVSDVIPLDQVDEKLSAMVLVRLDPTTTPECLREIAGLVKRYRGDRPVYLDMWTRDGIKVTIRGGSGCGVCPSPDFLQAMEEIVGAGRVEALPAIRVQQPPPMAASEPEPSVHEEVGGWADDAVDQYQTTEP
jgi:DNA polymerase-3 subunit alpha